MTNETVADANKKESIQDKSHKILIDLYWPTVDKYLQNHQTITGWQFVNLKNTKDNKMTVPEAVEILKVFKLKNFLWSKVSDSVITFYRPPRLTMDKSQSILPPETKKDENDQDRVFRYQQLLNKHFETHSYIASSTFSRLTGMRLASSTRHLNMLVNQNKLCKKSNQGVVYYTLVIPNKLLVEEEGEVIRVFTPVPKRNFIDEMNRLTKYARDWKSSAYWEMNKRYKAPILLLLAKHYSNYRVWIETRNPIKEVVAEKKIEPRSVTPMEERKKRDTSGSIMNTNLIVLKAIRDIGENARLMDISERCHRISVDNIVARLVAGKMVLRVDRDSDGCKRKPRFTITGAGLNYILMYDEGKGNMELSKKKELVPSAPLVNSAPSLTMNPPASIQETASEADIKNRLYEKIMNDARKKFEDHDDDAALKLRAYADEIKKF